MDEAILGRDLRLEPAPDGSGFGLVADFGDLSIAAGADNVVQALLVRFNTPLGELTELGHPDYGTRLHDLIGRPNNQVTRNLIRLFTLETLRQEPRVAAVESLDVQVLPGRPDQVLVPVRLRATGAPTPLNLVFTVALEGPG
jgi:phage baseplate assembly protein W